MKDVVEGPAEGRPASHEDVNLIALAALASHYRISADAQSLRRELALGRQPAEEQDLVRAAQLLGLKARICSSLDAKRLAALPVPALIKTGDGHFEIFAGMTATQYRVANMSTRSVRLLSHGDLLAEMQPCVILIQRRLGGAGADPARFGFRWFLPSIWRYRLPLGQALLQNSESGGFTM